MCRILLMKTAGVRIMWMALIISHKSARAIVVETVLVVDLQLNLCEVTLDLHGKVGGGSHLLTVC